MNPTLEHYARQYARLLPHERTVYDDARLWGCGHARAMTEAMSAPFPENVDYSRGYDVGRARASRGNASPTRSALATMADNHGQEYADGYRDGMADYESEARIAGGMIAGKL